MAESRFATEQYTSEAFVESAGAVLFRLSTQEICVLHVPQRNEYVLAKGRRNCGETRKEAAVREVREETGFACDLLPLNMHTRSPPAVETGQLDDQARLQLNIREPITLHLRHRGEGQIKLIWWFVAAVDEGVPQGRGEGFGVEFYRYEDALDKLTFRSDRDLVKKAIELPPTPARGTADTKFYSHNEHLPELPTDCRSITFSTSVTSLDDAVAARSSEEEDDESPAKMVQVSWVAFGVGAAAVILLAS